MRNKAFRMTTLVILTLTILLTTSLATVEDSSSLEEWVPYIPNPDILELQYLEQDASSYINVSITFASSGFNVSSWGTPIFDGNSISVDAKIWRWTGVSLPVVITVKHLYNLGCLSPGEYNFTFKVWSFSVKSITFVVRDGADVDIDPSCGGGSIPHLY